jgi:4'-phosphopantetheinyl transferase
MSGSATANRETAESRIIPLTPAEIHMWLVFYDEISDERLHTAYRELLDAAEKEQEPRFYFARDRHRYLVTRALVRTILSRYVPIAPGEWAFSTNTYGRPEIVNAQATDLSFNISHTHSLIVMGVTRQRALGVDVENVRARSVSVDIAGHFFAPQEVAVLAATPSHQQQDRFFEYWTFKESYIKARGMGLSLPLDKFSFHYPDDHTVAIAIHPDLADDPARWQFWQCRPSPDYLVAVCAERVGARSPSLIVKKTIPMQSDEPFPLDFQRVSEDAPQES